MKNDEKYSFLIRLHTRCFFEHQFPADIRVDINFRQMQACVCVCVCVCHCAVQNETIAMETEQ